MALPLDANLAILLSQVSGSKWQNRSEMMDREPRDKGWQSSETSLSSGPPLSLRLMLTHFWTTQMLQYVATWNKCDITAHD